MKKPLPFDPRFENVDYHSTDVAATFARVRRRMQEDAEKKRRLQQPVHADQKGPSVESK